MRERTVVIHQPDFMPYLGFFHRLLQCELFVILDHVQFSRGGWHNRDQIKTAYGPRWLTVPVRKAGHAYAPINQTSLKNDENWRAKHLRQIEEAYREAAFFKPIFAEVSEIYAGGEERMVDFNVRGLRWLMEKFDTQLPVVFSSNLDPQGKSNAMLVDILSKVGATTYLSGVGARAYYDPVPFDEAGIRVIWQEFRHPTYPQLHEDFVPYLSSLDLLMNVGEAEARRILRESL